ncbi:MAG: GGDEF domain-containing protein [Nitrospiraceae bacterium]|nr:MAG: GGDEF domain-containing protein [Nitrospiraceae bacterium]
MSFIENSDNLNSSEPDRDKDEMPLEELITSSEWVEYLNSLSDVINFELSLYDSDGNLLFNTKEKPVCHFIKHSCSGSLDCPGSCLKLTRMNEPAVMKCSSMITCFVIPLERYADRVFIIGRNSFAEYEDMLAFLRIIKENRLPEIPVSLPFEFKGEDNARGILQYVYLTVVRMLSSHEKKYRLEEKLIRMTSLFDGQTFRTLSRNPDLMYRYILDTIGFVLGHVSSMFLSLDRDSAVFRTVCSTGRFQDAAMNVEISSDSPAVREIINTGSAYFSDNPASIISGNSLHDAHSLYLIPILLNNSVEGLIGVIDKQLSREDMKILNAFSDYIQLNLENYGLRMRADESKKEPDRKMDHVFDVDDKIISAVDIDMLSIMLLEKCLKMLNAEKGSLMLLDDETSELVVEAHKGTGHIIQEKMRVKIGEGIAGKVFNSGGSLVVADIENDPRVRQENRSHYRTKSFISVLIKLQDRVAGVLNVADKIEGEAFDDNDLKQIQSFISSVSVAIERSLLFKKAEHLKKLSITDPLTGIYNRRYLNKRLSEEITRYNRYKHPFSFMMLDMDKFKEYNDTFGHIAGDNLIKALAQRIARSLRTIDIAARFGGDEFVAIFPQTPKVDAIQITNRLKEKIDETLREQSLELPLSVSMGLATYPDDASSIMELIEKTDQALYLAKKGGGNRVVYL